jgi:hypothetical protein
VAYEGHENRPDVIKGSITVFASAIRGKQRQQSASVLYRLPKETTGQQRTPYFLSGRFCRHLLAPSNAKSGLTIEYMGG